MSFYFWGIVESNLSMCSELRALNLGEDTNDDECVERAESEEPVIKPEIPRSVAEALDRLDCAMNGRSDSQWKGFLKKLKRGHICIYRRSIIACLTFLLRSFLDEEVSRIPPVSHHFLPISKLISMVVSNHPGRITLSQTFNRQLATLAMVNTD